MLTQNLIAVLVIAFTVTASPLIPRQILDEFNEFTGFLDEDQTISNSGQNAVNVVSNTGDIGGDFTVEQSTKTCGNAQLNCCNKVETKGDTFNSGVLASILGSGDVGIQCSPVNVAVVGAQVPVSKACDAKAACCQGDTTQNGLVNVGCVALTSLL